ncbi:hypothetical protein FF36_00469 [Frankia torreyi]|uniref:Uncharacterized protein n=1 Tax=Frankia torreyi TaxID=1856 RepID=A0A0D8BMH0_9ACTN|nr:hypothetical protein FF36_00469 [Frankia torreyi]KQM07848.1 hypothetical protein FF86_1001104 [Frankia sp. CpI1-P]
MPPGGYKWIVGFSTVNLVVATVGSAAVRRRFGDTAAQTFQRRAGTVVSGLFIVWAAVFWGLFPYGLFGAGLFLVSFLVECYCRRRARAGRPPTTDTRSQTRRDDPTADQSRSTAD